MTADWIWVTLAIDGYRKRIRASAVPAYGRLPNGGPAFIEWNGRAIEVRESEDALARLLGDVDVLRK